MVTVTASTAFNMATFKIYSGSTVFSSSNKIVISDGTRIGTYTGTSLSQSYSGSYLGTVTGYSQSLDGFESFDVTGLSVNQLTLTNLIRTTPKKLFEFVLAEDDDMTGSDGNDYLMGFAGDDVLDGGAGDDKLAGGLGDDTFHIDSVKDIAIEKANEGIDMVLSGITYILGKELEDLQLTDGMGNLSGTGNKSDNSIFGNDGNNTINGKEGNDYLEGGVGLDKFVFNTKLSETTNLDDIGDFISGTDAIYLSKMIFSAYKKAGVDLSADFGTFNSKAFVLETPQTAAAHSNTHFLYDIGTGDLYYDADGSGSKAAMQFATLTGHPTLVASDFDIF